MGRRTSTFGSKETTETLQSSLSFNLIVRDEKLRVLSCALKTHKNGEYRTNAEYEI